MLWTCDTASPQCHYDSSDTTEVKPWDRDSVVSKITVTCETKARCVSDTSAIDGFEKNSKTYFDDSRVIPTSSVLRKRGTSQCEKTIFIFCSTEDIFYFLQHCLACKERREPADENTKTSNQRMLLNYKMTSQVVKMAQSPSSPSLLFHRWENWGHRR